MNDPGYNGDFWVYEYENDRSLLPVQLVDFPANRSFHPLGVDVLPATTTRPAYAFVANLDIKASVVDIFTVSDKAPYKAYYQRTLSHPTIHAPNSIIAISPTQIYVSVDHRFTERMPKWIARLSALETFLQAPLGWVAYVEIPPNGQVKYKTAANFVNFANGKAFFERKSSEIAYNCVLPKVCSCPKTARNWSSHLPLQPSLASMTETQRQTNSLSGRKCHSHFRRTISVTARMGTS